MKYLLLFFLLIPVVAYGQARTAESLADAPFTQLNNGNPRNGSVRHCISCKRQDGPCELAGAGEESGSDAIKLGGVWYCNAHRQGTGTGNIVGPVSSSDGEMALFSGTSGLSLKRSNTLSGIALLSSGVVTTLASTGSGNVVRDSGPTIVNAVLTTPSVGSFLNAQHVHETGASGGQLNASNVFSGGTIPPARIISGTITNARCLRVGGTGAIEIAAFDCGAGGGGTPGGASGNITANQSGAFGALANSSYNFSTGQLSLTQLANGNDLLNLIRATDTSPTGNLLRARNAANNADLFRLGVDGVIAISSTIISSNVAAPSTPASGTTVLWTDSTGKNLRAQDDAGNVSVTVRAVSCSGTDKVSAISSAGVVTCTPDQSTAGSGVITLNALTASDQNFVDVDDTNVTLAINSATATHTFTIGWTGTLAKGRQNTATVYNDQSNAYSTGAQDFSAAASLTVPTSAGASPATNAQIAYDSTSNTLEAGINGTNRTVAFTTGSQTFSDKTLDNSNVANLRDTQLTLQDNVDSTKTVNFELGGITSGTNRVVTVANAASVTVIPTTATTNQWVKNIDSAGVQQKTQPAFSDLSGTMGPTQGGTGQTAVSQGDLLYGDATNSWARLVKSATATRYLANTGASNNPQWDLVNLSNGVTGTLSDANLSANVSLLGSSIDLSGAEASGILAAARFPALTGDVTTTSGTVATTIAADAVTNAKLANMATATFKGRTTAGTGDPEDLTATQATALLNVATATLKGLVPAPGTSTGLFLRDDMTWAAGGGAGTGDMVLASIQTVTGAKTFDPAKLVVGGQSATPTPITGAFYRDTDDGKLYWAIDGSTWGEIYIAGKSILNLSLHGTDPTLANVSGVLPVAGGGTSFSDTTFSGNTHKLVTTTGTLTSGRCAEWDASGNIVQAAAACGSSSGGTPAGSGSELQYRASSSTFGAVTSSSVSGGNITIAGTITTTGTQAGALELTQGTAPTAGTTSITFYAPTSVTSYKVALPGAAASGIPHWSNSAGTVTESISGIAIADLTATGTPSSSTFLRGDNTWATPAGSGTVTATGGSLTANSVVLGAGTTDTKVVAGIVTDGTSKLTLGVAGTSVGSLDLKNATSGTITLAPVTGALGTVTLTLPARTDTLVTLGGTETLTAKTLTSPTIAKIANLTSNGPVFTSGGDGTLGIGTVQGNTTAVVTYAGAAPSTNDCAKFDLNGNLTTAGAACGSGGSGLTIGTTTITTGTATRVLYETSGNVVGEISGATSDGTTLTLTSPKIITALLDTNGNELFKFTATASAVNEFTIVNAATAGAPALQATGGDTNINISMVPKGTGVVTFAPTTAGTGVLSLADTNQSHYLNITPGSDITADRTFTITTGDASRTLSMAGNITTAADLITSGAFSLTLTTTASTNVTLPTTGTLATLAGAESLTNKKLGSLTTNGFVKTSGSDGTLSVDTSSYITASSADTLTNKTLDVEGTGNVITTVSVVDFPAAGCSNTTAVSFWDLPTSTPAVATCVSGTNTQKAYLDFADTTGGFSAQTGFRLPADFTGTMDAKITWLTTATTGNVKWSLSTICVATDATETDDPAFNTASTVTTAAAGVASRLQTSAITSVTITGCAAGEWMHVKIFRDGNDAADTIAATARLVSVQLILRRAQ